MTWPFVRGALLLPPGVHDVLRMERIVRLTGECDLDYRGVSRDDLMEALGQARLGLRLTRQELDAFRLEYERTLASAVSYREYLKTQEWADVRYFALRRARYRCPGCGRSRDLEVHHLTYDRRGSERMADLEVLCVWCHADAHAGPRRELVMKRGFAAFERRLGFHSLATVLNKGEFIGTTTEEEAAE